MLSVRNKAVIGLVAWVSWWGMHGQSPEGRWLWESYIVRGDTAQPYQQVEFTPDGRMLFRGFEMARWSCRKGKLKMQSSVEPSLNGRGHIHWTDADRMQWILDSTVLHFRRWKDDYMLRPLAGIWIYYDDPEVYIQITDSTTVTEYILADYGNEMSVAEALYLPGEQKIVFRNPAGFFNGPYQVAVLDDRTLELQSDGKTYVLEWDGEEAPPPPLHFDRDDISPAAEDARLPWTGTPWDAYDTTAVYYYTRSTYLPELARFKNTVEMDRFDLDREQGTLCVTQHLMKSHRRRPVIRRRCRGHVAESHNPFFPMSRPDRYRIVSTDTLYETMDHSFSCTLVEGVEGDKKFRYWMLNNMPGVYVRVIVQYPADREGATYYIREFNDWGPANQEP